MKPGKLLMLGPIQKQGDSITTYFNRVKSLSDTLVSTGQALRQEEFISYLLNGLDENYDSIVESVVSRETPFPSKTSMSGCY